MPFKAWWLDQVVRATDSLTIDVSRATRISTGLNLAYFIEIIPEANVGIGPSAEQPLFSLDFLCSLPVLMSK
jgi:hypothetical protein